MLVRLLTMLLLLIGVLGLVACTGGDDAGGDGDGGTEEASGDGDGEKEDGDGSSEEEGGSAEE